MRSEANLVLLVVFITFYGELVAARENVALKKGTVQSNPYPDWESSKAVDGFQSRCSSARRPPTFGGPWWLLDLGNDFQVGQIHIYGFKSTDGQTGKFDVYGGDFESSLALIYHNEVIGDAYYAAGGHIQIIGNFIMRYLKIQNDLTYLTLCEVEVYPACTDYHFEPDCQECHCHGSPCDKITAVCPAGCATRWFGISCNKTCPEGQYGHNCTDLCRCLHSSQCDIQTGACNDRLCAFGLTGEYCNISTSIAIGKNVSMKNQFDTWRAELAVDGNLNTLANKCACCAATQYTSYPWLRIDLGKDYRIVYITIYGRTDYSLYDQSYGNLQISARRHNQTSESFIYGNTANVYFLNITLTKPVIAQYLELTVYQSNRLLQICELQIFEGACENGTFGRLCDNACFCEGEPCYGDTGICPSGRCQPGYQGQNCSQECNDGMYGKGCESVCGNCVNGTACDKYNGTCDDCSPGYIGVMCRQPCSPGMFGTDCLSVCGNCSEDKPCDHVTGICQNDCQPGYQKPFCNEICPVGKYGINCRENCGHCYSNSTCDLIDGHCDSGGCYGDFIPPLCSSRRQEQSAKKNGEEALHVGALAGIIVGAVVILLVVAVVVAVVIRRRTPKRQKLKDDFKDEKDDQTINAARESTIPTDLPTLGTRHTEEKQQIHNDGQDVSVTRTGDEYYEFAPRKEDVIIHQIWDYIQIGMDNNCSLLNAEFQNFTRGLQLECKIAQRKENLPKHRYREIYAYDYNRVKLHSAGGKEEYINASFIDGYEKVAKFIASQGPTKEMVEDFFSMIWQEKCSSVVMLTDTFENGMLKCLQYWPVDNDEVTFGAFTVKVQKEDVYPDFVIRHIQLNKGADKHTFKQFHFLSWLDKSVPTTAWSLVNFWRAVNKESNLEDSKVPFLVHCSAGVGRTGTYIALDNLYNQAKKEGCIRPMQIVDTLRRQRVNMVQTKQQYVYMHEAVAEALLLGTHFVLVTQFEDVLEFMSEKGEGANKTNLEMQYELLEMSLEENRTLMSDANVVYHNNETRQALDKAVNEDDVYTNIRNTRESDIKVCQSAVKTTTALDFKSEESFIIVEEPLTNDLVDEFWNLVKAKHPSTVILVKVHEETAFCRLFQSDDGETKGNLRIKDIGHHRNGQEGIADYSLKLFEYSSWKTGDYGISQQQSILHLLTEVFLWQAELSNKKPIILINNEYNEAGVLCVLLNELARIRTSGRINILEMVKRLRESNPALVNSFEQYKFCHDVILLSLTAESDVYQNC